MTRKYIYHRPDGSASAPCGLTRAMTVAATRIVQGAGRFKLTEDGTVLADTLKRVEVLAKLKQQASKGEVGPTFRVRNEAGDVVFWLRAVRPAPEVIDTSGNTKADEWWTFVKTTYPKYNPRFAGAYVCKDIAGTSTLSQHSYGNAVDIFFDTPKHQSEVAQAATHGHCARNVIDGDRIWHLGTWSHYSGEYHSHLHVDFQPECSGPCGVQETGKC